MKTITIIPKNEEVMPLITEFLSNNDWITDFEVYENGAEEYISRTPNEETLQAIRDVEEGKINYIGTIEDYLE
jgi:hypothetical protein